MAKIAVENIEDIGFNIIPYERRFDSTGDLAIHPKVRDKYAEKGYSSAPKNQEEADKRGITNFNGLNSSAVNIQVYSDNNRNFLTLDIAATRYLIGQAMRDCLKEGNYAPKQSQRMSPDMLNVSLIAPVRIRGEYFLLSQIKGKTLGSDQLHSGLVAGNVDSKYLHESNPLVTALQNECSEEVGLDLSYMKSSSFIFLIDERETGQINLASVATNVDMDHILQAYGAMTRKKLESAEDLEVDALAHLPIAGLSLVSLEDGLGVKGVTTFRPSATGLIEKVEDKKVRPYTSATVDFLSKSENVRFLLEKAGF